MQLEGFNVGNNEENEALGLELDDIPDELEQKEVLVNTLIEKINDPAILDNEREAKKAQLEMIDGNLGHIKTFLQKEGNSLDLVADVDRMREKIKTRLSN